MKTANDPFVIENLEEDTGFLMLQISRLWQQSQDRALKKHYGLSHIQYAVLASIFWLILHTEKEVTQIILAKHTKIDPMTISQMFKVLEKKGYLYRKTHSTDVRAKSVFLTEKGIELMSKAVVTVVNMDKKFFQILGKDHGHFNKSMVALLNAND